MKNNIDLTFGIPMYNAEKYINELIKCFKNTNKFRYEILIVDDGSKDNSYKICQQTKNKNLKVIQQKNQGVSVARNTIIKNASGKWITFIDADDLIDFDKYEKVFLRLINSTFDLFINCPKEFNRISREKVYKYLIETEYINSPVMKFYKRNVLVDNSILFDKNLDLGEDLLFNITYFEKCENVGFYNEELYVYRSINDDSLSKKYRGDKFEILMNVNNKCLKVCSNKYVKASFEYIRIKNCLSALKSELYFSYLSDIDLKKLVVKMKKYKKYSKIKTYFIKSNMIYILWYLTPHNLIIFLGKLIFRRKKQIN